MIFNLTFRLIILVICMYFTCNTITTFNASEIHSFGQDWNGKNIILTDGLYADFISAYNKYADAEQLSSANSVITGMRWDYRTNSVLFSHVDGCIDEINIHLLLRHLDVKTFAEIAESLDLFEHKSPYRTIELIQVKWFKDHGIVLPFKLQIAGNIIYNVQRHCFLYKNHKSSYFKCQTLWRKEVDDEWNNMNFDDDEY